ncbi:3-hydroxyacyl-[acyl-carrier-protein] dehydratase FabZ [Stenotrophobium rhamnosiphilum]|uniref:3-hydroxyacyl-[acyl-carrier-protein] dehydratase FabZ n=1 Tax=Stenotrophobium rhamnosiphilum TaxID=2029166 RepID=A0A2T5MHU5_9GAMM|nr:3-hydroxyacyl-[acyl-carrier-protein] dehydratase FabZ [Stenotrophobium rhamnosiphilum]
MRATVNNTIFDIREIMGMLAHRYPFLLVDRVIGYEPGKSMTALKNVTMNEHFFLGHFPGLPTMPGVLMVEAMAQVCGLYTCQETGLRANSGKIFYFAAIEECRFKRIVVPGDQLILKIEFEKQKRTVYKFKGTVHVGDEIACEAGLTCVIKDVDRGEEGK